MHLATVLCFLPMLLAAVMCSLLKISCKGTVFSELCISRLLLLATVLCFSAMFLVTMLCFLPYAFMRCHTLLFLIAKDLLLQLVVFLSTFQQPTKG
jgi:hypothetical protein